MSGQVHRQLQRLSVLRPEREGVSPPVDRASVRDSVCRFVPSLSEAHQPRVHSAHDAATQPGVCYDCLLLLPDAGTMCLSRLQVYKNFVEAVDAIDNGVNQFDCDTPAR